MTLKVDSNLYHPNWNKTLKRGDLKGRQVEKMAKAVKGKSAEDLQYDRFSNTITCGSQTLNLSKLNKSKFSLRLFHRFRMCQSKRYKCEKLGAIDHLAELIEKKINVYLKRSYTQVALATWLQNNITYIIRR